MAKKKQAAEIPIYVPKITRYDTGLPDPLNAGDPSCWENVPALNPEHPGHQEALRSMQEGGEEKILHDAFAGYDCPEIGEYVEEEQTEDEVQFLELPSCIRKSYDRETPDHEKDHAPTKQVAQQIKTPFE